MSEEKRIPYSVYLTPKATSVLNSYVKGSGLVSVSRTVEEVVLSFDSIYKSVQDISKLVKNIQTSQQPPEQQNSLVYALLMFLSSIQNATSRLSGSDGQVPKEASK
jgi:hypothetical protein